MPLDPGLRRVLEASFSVDLSGIRLHAGPPTAEEHPRFAERMAATGIRPYRAVSQEEAYHQYLSFLAARSVQLSSKQVHDHFNGHQGGALKTEAEQVFGHRRAVTAGAASSTMGMVSVDQTAGLTQIADQTAGPT